MFFEINDSVKQSILTSLEQLHLPLTISNSRIKNFIEPPTKLREDFTQEIFEGKGYLLLDLNEFKDSGAQIKDIATLFTFTLGKPISLWNKEPFWEPLKVDLKARPNRTHGIGENPFHMDLVNRTNPPDVIAFLGKRHDSLGGGFTEIANIFEAIKILNREEKELLEQPIFHYWPDIGVKNVGRNIEYYPIVPQGLEDGYIRFTAKMLPHLDGTNTVLHPNHLDKTKSIKKALEKIYTELHKIKLRFLVKENHLLFFNQRVFVHRRTELGKNQETLSKDKRRLMFQSYMRDTRRRYIPVTSSDPKQEASLSPLLHHN